MKILLVGEFSRLHNSLKEGLEALGHEVLLIGNGDLFKKYPVDIDINSSYFNSYILNGLRNVIYRLFKFDIADFEVACRFKKALPRLKDFDIVQLINEDALAINPAIQIRLLKKTIKQNKKLFLLCCGDDFLTINYYLNNSLPYSILTPYLTKKAKKSQFQYSLKYVTKPYKKLHSFLYKHIKGVIASDIDYHIPLKSNKHYLGLIANPINTDLIKSIPNPINNKINIFHGVNSISSIKKGSDIINSALNIIKEKYPDKINIKITHSLPYNEYISIYNDAHIIMDQVYGFDQGYNALEAMAKGKVVFTGAEKEWLEHYNLEEDTIAINALPNANEIAEKLEWLILNPDKITEISNNARKFIEKEHDYKLIAKKYLDTWAVNRECL